MAFGWLKKAVNGAGKAVGGAVNAAGKQIGKVPGVGKGLKGVFTIATGPITLTASIAKGDRVDKAALNHLRSQVKSVKEVAPYAQMVIQVVPGVGQGVSGALSAGLALASGQPIDKAIMEGVKNSIPGGPAAKAAFDVGIGAVQGKRIDEIALKALPIPDAQKKAVASALKATADIAQGKRVDQALLNASLKNLPPDIKKGLDAGIAIAHGANIQKTVVKSINPQGLAALAKVGANIAATNPVLKAGATILNDKTVKSGYDLGLGVMSNKVKPFDLVAIRKNLNANQQKGFDIALSAHMGITSGATKNAKNPKEAFGMAATKGMIGAPSKTKETIVKSVAVDPAARTGVSIVITAEAAKRKGWWRRMLDYLGISQKAA